MPSIEQSIVLALILPFGVLGNSISIELTVYLVYFVLFYLLFVLQLTLLTEREIPLLSISSQINSLAQTRLATVVDCFFSYSFRERK